MNGALASRARRSARRSALRRSMPDPDPARGDRPVAGPSPRGTGAPIRALGRRRATGGGNRNADRWPAAKRSTGGTAAACPSRPRGCAERWRRTPRGPGSSRDPVASPRSGAETRMASALRHLVVDQGRGPAEPERPPSSVAPSARRCRPSARVPAAGTLPPSRRSPMSRPGTRRLDRKPFPAMQPRRPRSAITAARRRIPWAA